MKYIFTILFFLVSLFAFSQLPNKMFEQQWLDNPIEFAHEIEKCFQYNEIDTFVQDSTINSVLLVNGYAKFSIINNNNWKVNVIGREVKTITIIFTKYPLYKKDWITNYYVLAANRLNELFRIDSTLNSNEIRWELLLQTNCKTGKQAEKMLHGILLDYKIVKIVKSHTIQVVKARNDSDFIKEIDWNKYYNKQQPVQTNNRKRTLLDKKKENIKKKKEPKCANFGDKKKKFRIFRKK